MSVSLTTGALVSLSLLLLATIVVSWLATDQAVHAALGQYSEERVFIESYWGSLRQIALLGAVPVLAIPVVLLGMAVSVWRGTGRPSAVALGFPWLATACGYGGLATTSGDIDLTGEPDGRSLVLDYVPAWYSPTALTLVALMVIGCLTATVLLATSRSSPHRNH